MELLRLMCSAVSSAVNQAQGACAFTSASVLSFDTSPGSENRESSSLYLSSDQRTRVNLR